MAITSLLILATFNMRTRFEGFRDDDNGDDDTGFKLNYNLKVVNQDIHFTTNL